MYIKTQTSLIREKWKSVSKNGAPIQNTGIYLYVYFGLSIRKAGILNQFFLFLTPTYIPLCVSMSVCIEYDTCMIILPIHVPDLDYQMTKQAKQIVFDV